MKWLINSKGKHYILYNKLIIINIIYNITKIQKKFDSFKNLRIFAAAFEKGNSLKRVKTSDKLEMFFEEYPKVFKKFFRKVCRNKKSRIFVRSNEN